MGRSKRDKRCLCGSGKKRRNCCMGKKADSAFKIVPDGKGSFRQEFTLTPEEIAEAKKALQTQKPAEEHMPFVPSVVWNGFRWRALYGKLYKRNIHETFHEFILWHLKSIFGAEWREEQDAVNSDKRHILLTWLKSMQRLSESKVSTQHSEHLWSAEMTGEVRALIQFAYDVFCLEAIHKLPDFLITKLKNYNEFQGARYEVAVAAMIARAGFDIEFLDDKCGQESHCEFIATHRKTKIKYGVEAKSRRRPGVLHQYGVFDVGVNFKGDVKNLFKKALKQKPEGLPYIIFIDLNLPHSGEKDFRKKRWFPDIDKILSDEGKPTEENPDGFNALFFTNYAFYYCGDERAAPGGEYLGIISPKPLIKVSISDSGEYIQPLIDIKDSVDKYSVIPKEV